MVTRHDGFAQWCRVIVFRNSPRSNCAMRGAHAIRCCGPPISQRKWSFAPVRARMFMQFAAKNGERSMSIVEQLSALADPNATLHHQSGAGQVEAAAPSLGWQSWQRFVLCTAWGIMCASRGESFADWLKSDDWEDGDVHDADANGWWIGWLLFQAAWSDGDAAWKKVAAWAEGQCAGTRNRRTQSSGGWAGAGRRD